MAFACGPMNLILLALAHFCEVRVLREKAIARMDSIDIAHFGRS
jgi:hypothetical protein